jgi:16S rRNA (cytosine967-C5)-methyltransferase
LAERRPLPDPARRAAFDVLRAVSVDGAYANLLLPSVLTERGVAGRDAALATELCYGTLRASGTLDEVIAACADRPLDAVDPGVRDLLRLGAYQALRTRIPPHAAVASTVDLARAAGHGRAAGFVNAVLRRVTAMDWTGWVARLGQGRSELQQLALSTAHPEWIAAAFADALGGDLVETAAALTADDARPVTHLVAWPGRIEREALLAESGGQAGSLSPYAVHLSDGGDPAQLAAIRTDRAAVQDEGSQLAALALAAVPLDGPDVRWLDLCAGPGGKTALLASLAAPRGVRVLANELHPHRAELVRRAVAGWDVEVHTGDARELHPSDLGGPVDRVLVDAPCTGLGALRRRPEARWRRSPDDVAGLASLQRELLSAAVALVRPGGVLGYVTCSPHRAETTAVTESLDGLVDAVDAWPLVAPATPANSAPAAQLWPHRHGTDAMFIALYRVR